MGEIESVEGVREGNSRLGPSGLFHMDSVKTPMAATPSNKIPKTSNVIFRLPTAHYPFDILL